MFPSIRYRLGIYFIKCIENNNVTTHYYKLQHTFKNANYCLVFRFRVTGFITAN